MSIKEIVDAVASEFESSSGRKLTNSQLKVLGFCLQDEEHARPLTYEDMAAKGGYTFNTLRGAGSNLFKALSELLRKSLDRENCNRLVRDWYRQKKKGTGPLYGREDDLRKLTAAIQFHAKRLIGVHGPPGIGKKVLVRTLCQQMSNPPDGEFVETIWCNTRILKTVADLYQYVCEELNERQPSALPAPMALTRLLRQRPFFLLLHNIDGLYDPQYPDGRFHEHSSCYEDWLREIRQHDGLRSCVIVVGRLLPRCLNDDRPNLYRHPLKPLQQHHAMELIKNQDLSDLSDGQLEELIHFCGRIPGVLTAIAIRLASPRDHGGDYYSLVASTSLEVGDAWEIYLGQLSKEEQAILAWLLLYPFIKIHYRRGRLYAQEQPLPISPVALDCLITRDLIEFDVRNHPLLPSKWVRYFVARHVSACLVQAYVSENLNALDQYPLLVATAPLWHRQWQEQWVLKPLDELLRKMGQDVGSWSRSQRSEQIYGFLQQVCNDEELRQGYVTGNLLNIAVALNLSLDRLAFANMTICNADLSSISLRGMRVHNCRFVNHVLPVHLHGQLVAAMSPDGTTIAVGDAEGRICCWQRQNEFGFYKLYRFTRIRNADGAPVAISKLSFGNDQMLGIVAERQVYHWWLLVEQDPDHLISLSDAAISLVCCDNEFVAVGLESGDIQIKQEMEPARSLKVAEGEFQCGHMGAVKVLAANLNSGQLLSIGHGDRILIWDIWDPDSSPREVNGQNIYYQLACHSEGWVAAVYSNQECYLRSDDESWQQLPYQRISKLCFSRNGAFMAVRKGADERENISEIEIQSLDQQNRRTIPDDTDLQELQICNDGCWLMTIAKDYPHSIRLWNTYERKMCWELSAESQTATHMTVQLSNCEGLSNAERAFWTDYGANL